MALGKTDPALVAAVQADLDRINGTGFFKHLVSGGYSTMLKRYFNYLAQKCINIT